MASTVDVMTGLGDGPFSYREMGLGSNAVGILTGNRVKPRIITTSMRGYYLGLHDEEWSRQRIISYGNVTYFTKVVPICADLTDPDGSVLVGTATVEVEKAGTTFLFRAFPDGYFCTGYQVWAGTVKGTLYYQGTLTGRYNTVFTIGSTWPYVTTGAALNPLAIGPPAFASCSEVYQLEGNVNTRLFLSGGLDYNTGFASVSKVAVTPMLTGGVTAEDDHTVWAAITAGSFRMRLRKILASSITDNYFEFTGLDFHTAGSMADVAAILQTAYQAGLPPKLSCGLYGGTYTDFTGISDGSFSLSVNGVFVNFSGIDLSGVASMADVATALNTAMAAYPVTCTWDSVATRFYFVGQTPGTTVSGVDSFWTKGSTSVTSAASSFTSALIGQLVVETVDTEQRYRIVAVPDGNTLTIDPAWVLDNVQNRAFQTYSVGTSLSYLGRHATATGTDISELLKGRETSDGVFLCAVGNEPNSDTVTWSTDHFIFTGVAASTITGADMGVTNGSNEVTSAGSTFTSDMVGQLLKIAGNSTIYRIRFTPVVVMGTATKLVIDPVYSGTSGTNKTFATHYDGGNYQIDYAGTVVTAKGTDISTMLGCREVDVAVRRYGQTAYQSVVGYGTKWGNWCDGMRFKCENESNTVIVRSFIEDTMLYLDDVYDGDALLGPQEYTLIPYNQQVYASSYGNPFKFDTDNIIQLPTDDSDSVFAMSGAGNVIAIFMDHHIWFIDGVDITTPRLVDGTHGCPYLSGVVKYLDKAAAFTGEDFVLVSGTGVQTLDQDKRVRHLINRLNSNADIEPFGVYLSDEDTDVIMWWLPIDDSYTPNVALCYEPSTGNWWVYNHKGVSCATILRDARKNVHLVTGLPSDTASGSPSFTLLHSRDYYSDAASTGTAYTKQGLIGSVGANTQTAGYIICGTSGALATFQAVTEGYFTLDVDDGTYLVGPINFSAAATMAACATLIQTAIRAKTGGSETCAYSTDHFVITSGTTTNRSVVDYLRAGYGDYDTTNIAGVSYMNGLEGVATKTYPVNTIVLNLTDYAGTTAALYNENDKEKSVYVYLCDSNYRNGAYAKITTNTVSAITVTPVPSSVPVAGWHWYVGGIVPSWMKWFDFSSPHHKNKVGAIAVTSRQNQGTADNVMVVHGMQDLVSTIRTTKTQALGMGQDPTNMIFLSDKPATQQGVKIIRPSSTYEFEIDDITIIHSPIV
jgi:hypothetical protein